MSNGCWRWSKSCSRRKSSFLIFMIISQLGQPYSTRMFTYYCNRTNVLHISASFIFSHVAQNNVSPSSRNAIFLEILNAARLFRIIWMDCEMSEWKCNSQGLISRCMIKNWRKIFTGEKTFSWMNEWRNEQIARLNRKWKYITRIKTWSAQTSSWNLFCKNTKPPNSETCLRCHWDTFTFHQKSSTGKVAPHNCRLYFSLLRRPWLMKADSR